MEKIILLGADPELFVKDKGVFISGYNLIPGTKDAPYPVKKGAVQVDGMALEFNIDPAKNSKEFIDNITTVLSQLAKMVPDYQLVTESVADFDEEYMKAQPAEATRLGCDPDFNAYSLQENSPPDGTRNFRTAAGHVHVGWGEGFAYRTEEHMADCALVAKQLDVILGVPSVLYDASANANRRRELYGKAGAFRPKPYGMEYRVLSNRWLTNPGLMEFIYNKTIDGIKKMFDGDFLFDKITDAERVINESDRTRAKEICDMLGFKESEYGVLQPN